MSQNDELFAIRIALQDSYNEETDIIRELKNYLVNNSVSMDEANNRIYEFYKSFGVDFSLDFIRNSSNLPDISSMFTGEGLETNNISEESINTSDSDDDVVDSDDELPDLEEIEPNQINITNPLQGVLRSGGASGTDVTSNYAYVTIGAYREWNAVWSDNTAGYNQSVSYIKVADWGGGHTSSPNGMGGTINFQMNIGGVHNSANHVNFYSLEYDGLSSAIPYLANVTHHSTHYGTGTHTGIRLFNNGSNYVRGTIKIYGLK